jgi:exonuclease SbcC
LEEKRVRHRHLEVLSQKFDELRSRLNSQIRPGLSERASQLITALTDGRYSQVDLDEEYTPRLFDDGEFKPVISGGEEDILHLSLRLAVSQMIAERAGLDLGLLVLDEVFGSLDEARRDSVIALLQNLKGAFPQILLITHIESIHDMVDRCLRVEYDAARQASVVRESLELSFEELPSGPQPAPGKKNPVREDRGQ